MEVPFLSRLLEYSVLGIVVAVLFFILWQIICWAKTFISSQAIEYNNTVIKLTEEHNKERLIWLETYQAINRSIESHNLSSIEARKTTEESHRYQKAEHEKMLENLTAVCASMKQTELALGRINGYTK